MTGTDLIYSTYYWGSFIDYSNDLVIDPEGNIYICGSTTSPDSPTKKDIQVTIFPEILVMWLSAVKNKIRLDTQDLH